MTTWTIPRLPDFFTAAAWMWKSVPRRIVERALENNSLDNVSCQLLKVEQLPHQDEHEFYQQFSELPFPPPLEPGMVLDGYKIVRELHASKRTQVYLAIDNKTDNRVILKTPSVNYVDDAEYIDGFLHEEWAGRRIRNQHVLKVFEPHGRRQCLYYVTEYIDGWTLRQWMHDNPHPALEDVREIVGQIAAGLRAFHRQEMVHQDLKPENIMIDRNGTVKIIDFGSTRIAGIEEISTPLERNNLLGTRNYTAPEYLQGMQGDNVSDIYSLGVITYEMLTGELPYGKHELTARRLRRARYHPAMRLNPDVPLWIDKALEKATAIDRRRRYATVVGVYPRPGTPEPGFRIETCRTADRAQPAAGMEGHQPVFVPAEPAVPVPVVRFIKNACHGCVPAAQRDLNSLRKHAPGVTRAQPATGMKGHQPVPAQSAVPVPVVRYEKIHVMLVIHLHDRTVIRGERTQRVQAAPRVCVANVDAAR